MNFQSVAAWAAGIAIASAAVCRLDDLQRWIWIAEAKVVAESRTSNWGSPRFFPRGGQENKTRKSSATL